MVKSRRFSLEIRAEKKYVCIQIRKNIILGPRQSGKTTLVYFFRQHQYISFEDPEIRRFAESDRKGFLGF